MWEPPIFQLASQKYRWPRGDLHLAPDGKLSCGTESYVAASVLTAGVCVRTELTSLTTIWWDTMGELVALGVGKYHTLGVRSTV